MALTGLQSAAPRQLGRTSDAWNALKTIDPRAIDMIAPESHRIANRLRVEGLLLLSEEKYDQGRAALKESLEIEELRRGPGRWRTKRVREELARVPAETAKKS